jgi:peptidoglycan/LPS O-acetylase OafA/YrhL
MSAVDHRGAFHLDGHSARLQSLRAIAALSVAVGHSFTLMINGRIEDPHFTLRPGNALLAAGEVAIQPNTAVVLFYVLSGFVLGEALRRSRLPSGFRHLLGFAIRRLWRLLPVMWISIAFAATVAIAFGHPTFPGTTNWFNAELTKSIDLETLLLNFLGLSYSINSVLWSIQIELAMIALLPLGVWVSRFCPLWGDFAITAALCVTSVILWNYAPNFILFAYCFYLGVFLPKLISSPLLAPVVGNGWCVVFAIVLLLPIDYLYNSNRLWMPYKFFMDAFISAHIIGFVMLRSDCPANRILDNRRLVWLGDVSYSFYAFDMTALIVCASLLLHLVPKSWIGSDLGATAVTIVAAAACVLVSGALAWISFVWIERPSIAIGRDWSRRIEFAEVRANFPADSSPASLKIPLVGKKSV